MSLANQYRPTEFSDVVEQDVVCKILTNQITNESFKHSILFAGNAGCGKTTCARIFASKIDGEIIEIDCASHNGVADIKEIVENAKITSLTNKYKVFILDECHTLTPQAWSSLLITLEENIPYSIFVFCTTDTQKIPNTIISRVQEFKFLPISKNKIFNRLKTVCEKEPINISDKSLQIIAKQAEGNLRQAFTYLDKCRLYEDLSDEAVCKVLGIVSDDVMQELSVAVIGHNIDVIINIIQSIYENGYILHIFMRQFLDYCLENYIGKIELIDRILKILENIKYDDNPKNLIIAYLICM